MRPINDPVLTHSMEIVDGSRLEVMMRDGCGGHVCGSYNLDDVLGINDSGKPEWDQTGISERVKAMTFEYAGSPRVKVTVEIEQKEQEIFVDLSERFVIVNKKIEYIKDSHVHETFITPPYLTDPTRDGNIVPGAFAVASDPRHDRAVVAYKTQVDDKISFAEASFKEGSWSLPTEINVYPDTIPGNRFALVYDPNTEAVASNGRHLFFSEEDGDGYVLMQSYEEGKWGKPEKLKTMDGKESSIKAHRFSGFAATFVTSARCADGQRDNVILLYFINESNELMEYTGKRYDCGYRWSLTKPIEEGLTMRGAISAVHRHSKTYVIYRNSSDELAMAIASNRQRMPRVPSLKPPKSEPRGTAEWENVVLLKKNQLSKNSPLAIAYPEKPEHGIFSGPVVFFLQREKKTETIYALQLPVNVSEHNHIVLPPPRPVGKLEPGSNLGAASLGRNWRSIYGVRLLSVSKLDGDNVLVERVQRRLGLQWVLSGGVVDTDVDHIIPSPHNADSNGHCGC